MACAICGTAKQPPAAAQAAVSPISMVLIEAQFEHICSQLGQGLLTGPAAELFLRQAAKRMPSDPAPSPVVAASPVAAAASPAAGPASKSPNDREHKLMKKIN